MSYGSWGVGSPGHLGAQQLESLTGTADDARALQGGVAAVRQRRLGRHPVGLRLHSVEPGIYKAGKLRYIAVAATKRVPQMPNVPTMAESGGPASLEVNSFVSLVAPKGVPAAVKAKSTPTWPRRSPTPTSAPASTPSPSSRWPGRRKRSQRNAEAKSKVYGELVKRRQHQSGLRPAPDTAWGGP